MFNSIKMNDFRCFNGQNIKLGNLMTVLSGRNSTGKSTILGMLGNAGELKKKYGATYTNGQFRAEFSELFKGSAQYDLTGSEKYEITMTDNNENVSDYRKFRITWQKKEKDSDEKRFHIVPYRNDEYINTSAKMNIPVLYLGLSRLFPIGEADEEKLSSTKIKFKTEEHKKWFCDNYIKILSMHERIDEISNTSLGETDKKRAIGVNTEKYDYLANSSGQDNLGQILLAILSFISIYEGFEGDWPGGLLLIDEFDATLHPAAQNRLIDLLLSEARRIKIQVVITTHSTSLLKYISTKTSYNKSEKNNNVELYYFSNANRTLEIKRNIDYSMIESDLLVESLIQQRRKIKVYSEDEENRWFFMNILNEFLGNIDVLEVSVGCTSLLTMYKADPMYFGNTLIILDGDVKDSDLNIVPAKIREHMGNVLRLPGLVRPEEVIYTYLLQLPPEHGYWASGAAVGFTWDYFNENGPMSTAYSQYPNNDKERDKYKMWFKEHVEYFNATRLFEYWKNDNEDVVNQFVSEFIQGYNSISNRLSIPRIR